MTDNRAKGRPMGPPQTLRELRIWHWRKVLLHRKNAYAHEQRNLDWNAAHPEQRQRPRLSAQAKAQHKIADWHLTAVQTLNEVVTGTAEADDA